VAAVAARAAAVLAAVAATKIIRTAALHLAAPCKIDERPGRKAPPAFRAFRGRRCLPYPEPETPSNTTGAGLRPATITTSIGFRRLATEPSIR